MRRLNIPGLLALALTITAGACEDSDGVSLGPGGDVNGSWVVQRASGATYIRVLPTAVVMYVEGDTCFEKSEYAIDQIDGPEFTLVSEDGSAPSIWSFERVGESLVVQIGAAAMTLEPAAVDLNTLAVCGGPEPEFPHPGCTNIPAIPIGGSETNALGEADAHWPSDDTWYDLWSLQLTEPATVTITMSSGDFDLVDPYLTFYGASGADEDTIDENDDIDFDGGNYNARVGPVDLEAGCYIIVAGSWQGDADSDVGGPYTLTVE